ncbi:hypothetical protein [Nocardia bovistercoris]|uniref:Uncharacterized protein n=1 Tax=Nocardia bovistercoris TaxID=2785916 RepID=A0A931IET7_9NOCA|nr:hypothetical protein [Nocardia bovistercoris]MBH0779921.1 hypothetical protein [Nocardia bovistercoris]
MYEEGVQLSGEQLERAREARDAIVKNVGILREIVHSALGGTTPSTESTNGLDLRISEDNCVTFPDIGGKYCDPPGICLPA